MESLFRPPPEVVAFLILQKFIYLQAMVVLACVQMAITHPKNRKFAALSLVFALIGLFCLFGPAALGLYSGPIPIYASYISLSMAGLLPHLLSSAAFLYSGSHWSEYGSWLDRLHILLLGVLIALFLWSL